MAGPWEQYQTTPTAPSAGPWTQYGNQGGGEFGYAAAPPEPPAPVTPSIPWNPVGDELGNIYTPAPPPSLDDIRSALPDADSLSVGGIRKAMAPEPGYVPTGILPFSLKETTPGSGVADPSSGLAGMHWDWGPVRSVVNPLLDLLEGTGLAWSVGGENAPLAGKVSPEATAFLAGSKLGNPVSQIRDPLAAAAEGGDIRFGAPQAQPPSTGVLGVGGDLRAAPLPDDFKAAPMTPGGSEAADAARTGVPVTRDAPLMTYFNRDETPPPTTPPPSTPTGIPAVAPRGIPPIQPATSAPPTQSPGPQSVGAAASREGTPASELGLTPAEEAAYRSTAEGNKLLEPQEPGVRDDTQYLTGERINEAQASQDVETARELQSLRQQTPALDAKMTADETHNNNIRANAINNAIPGQVQITAARTARQQAMETAEPKVFGNATDADVAPIVSTIQGILNDPKNVENSQLQQYVRPLIGRLQNADGTPKITNPLQLWSLRQDIQHLTSSAAQRGDPNLARVSGMLGKVLDTTDDQLEAAAPGYKANLRDDYRTRSREIDAMEALNAERFKLFDSQNKPNYNAVQSLMRRMVDARQGNDPYEPFSHVPQETLDKFWNIRDSMRRQAAVDRLGAPRGSPTSQNLGDALRAAGTMAVKNAAPAIGAGLGTALFPTMPMVGSTMGLTAGAAMNHLLSERALRQRFTRGLELTNPNTLMHPLP